MTEYLDLYRAGVELSRGGQVAEAEAALRQVMALQPGNPHVELALAFTLLAAGKYADGWPLLRARKQVAAHGWTAPSDAVPEWRGEALEGKTLLVATEQGRGDQLMLARFLPLLRERGARIVALTWREIAPVLAPLADAVVPVKAGSLETAVPRPDVWTHYFSLPELLGVTLANLPAAPYLAPPADRKAPDGYAGRIGLFHSTRDEARNIPDPLVQRLLAQGIVSLQPEDTGARDFADTAAIIERLDLVISIDTAVAHLAGAMGKPVWILLHADNTDWRWMLNRADTPWYPTARLFRQTSGDDWSTLVNDVEVALGHRGRAMMNADPQTIGQHEI